ncbi:MAG: hypothetical protein ACE5K1_12910 [Acidiferrobacterales bacterium]
MIDPHQYLRFHLGDVLYLISGRVSVAIDQRDNLQVNTGRGLASAWRVQGGDRWPAYCLDRELRAAPRGDWERAIFLEAQPHPVGLSTGEVDVLAQTEVQVAPFTPLGPPATRVGHLFTGAWVQGDQVTLVFDPSALVAYLQSLEG